MANAPAFRLERGEGSAYRVLGARADAAAARKAQPAARVEEQSDGNEREHAGECERAGGQSDDRHRAGRGRPGAAGSRSAQPAVLLTAREARSDHGRRSHGRRMNSRARTDVDDNRRRRRDRHRPAHAALRAGGARRGGSGSVGCERPLVLALAPPDLSGANARVDARPSMKD